MAEWTSDDIALIGDWIINHTTPDQRWRELADRSASWPCTGGIQVSLEKLKEWGKTHRWFQKRAEAFAERNPEHLEHLKMVYSILLNTVLDQGPSLGTGLSALSKLILDYQTSISSMLPREDSDGKPEFLSPDTAKDIVNKAFAELDTQPTLDDIELSISSETPQ